MPGDSDSSGCVPIGTNSGVAELSGAVDRCSDTSIYGGLGYKIIKLIQNYVVNVIINSI